MNAFLSACVANALMASVLALIVAVVCRSIKSPALRHTLWVLVLLKLLTPPVIGLPVPGIDAAEAGLGRWLNPPAAEAAPPAEPVLDEEVLVLAIEAAAEPDEPEVAPNVQAAEAPNLTAWFVGLWLVGTVGWFGWAGVRIARFHRLLRHAWPAPEPLQMQAEELAERLGLTWTPRVWLVPVSVSPLLWALGGRARLVLPAGLVKSLKPDEQASLLAHELAHLKRHDHWVRWVELAAIGLYWWHPVAWWARHQIETAEEECCDAWVVWSLPGVALLYAKTLLKTVDFLAEPRLALPPSASGAGHVHNLRRRVSMILHQSLEHRLSWPARLGALALAAAILPLAPHRLAAQSTTSDEPVVLDEPYVVTLAVNADDDDDDDAPAKSETANRDFDRRLRRLEQQIDRLARQMERSRGPEGEKREERREQRIIIRKPDTQGDKPKSEDGDKSPEAIIRFKKDLGEQIAKQVDPEKLKRMAGELKETIKQSIDTDKIKELVGKYKEAMKDETNPERRKELEQQLEKEIKQIVNPERIEKLAKEFEVRIRKDFNPEQIEALQRKLELSIEKQFGDQGEQSESRRKEVADKIRQAEEKARAKAREAKERAESKEKEAKERAEANERRGRERAEAAERRAREDRERRGRADSPRSPRESSDLDRRLRSLEERIEKLTRALDQAEKPR